MKSFLHFPTKSQPSSDGTILCEEVTYINQQAPANIDRCFLHCFAYSETFWRKGHKFYRNHDNFKDCKYGDERWIFVIVTDGDGVLKSDNIRYEYKPHDILIIRPGKQIFQSVGSSQTLSKRAIYIQSPLLKYICENSGLAGIDYIQSNDSSRLLKIYDRVKEIVLEPEKEYWQQALSNELYAFLNELNRLAIPHKYPVALHHALSIINANPYQDYTLDYLCSKCKISASVLFRHFKKYLGISPINYIIDRRLEQVKILLSISNMPLKEVAEECGYKSESFLSRSFKKKFGVSPSEFRKRIN